MTTPQLSVDTVSESAPNNRVPQEYTTVKTQDRVRSPVFLGKNGVINTVYNVGKIKEEGEYSLRGSKPVTDESVTMRSPSSNSSVLQKNTTVNSHSMQNSSEV